MRIDWWTLGLQTVNGLVLVWILARFLFRPVAAIVAARQAEAAKLIGEARIARDAAVAEQRTAAAETAHLASTRAEALKAAAQEAEAEKVTLLKAAREEADRVRAAAQDDLARTRQREAHDAGNRASRLAVEIAAKLFARLPEAARIAGFIDGLADGIAALPKATQDGIGADGRPVRIRAARALTGVETDACHAALSRALGRPVAIEVTADPDLIAGLELVAPHLAVRDNFRHDLDRIAAALVRDD